MINAVMTHIKNHFARSIESQAFEIVSDGIVGSFSEKYIAGQYVWIKCSFVNDGVYKITGVTTTKLTLDATLTEENTGKLIYLFGLAPPVDFLTVVTEIENFTSKDGVVSESIDDYSVSFGGAGGGDGSWTSVFNNKLSQWRRMYDDDYQMIGQYRIATKGWG